MTPQQLKNSILQQAIEGKLVEQRPEEGTGEELYQQIQKEKKKLIKEGKIKKEKQLPPITEDEVPFDIPENWKWCRLGEIVSLLSGADFKPSEYNSDHIGIPYMTGASNIEDGSLIINRWTPTPKCIANKGDLLIVCKGSGYGKNVICNIEKVHIARQFMALKASNSLNLSYIRILLDANVKNIKRKGKGVIPGIERNDILNMQCPLPPLPEQKRIVAKIEELQPYLEQYEKSYNRLESFNKRFPDDMKKSILQMAIEGKLVEQRTEEGTGEELYQQIQKEKQKLIKEGKIKKEKPLPPIADDEVPFDIPDNWKWIRIGSVINLSTGLSYKKEVLNDIDDNMVRVLRGGNIRDNKLVIYTDDIEISKKYVTSDKYLHRGDIITPSVTSIENIGKAAIILENMADTVAGGFVFVLSPIANEIIFSKYLHAVLGTKFFLQQEQTITHKSGQAFYNLSKSRYVNLPIPLPPLAEQKRIVAKIEELLPLCDQLKQAE